MKAARFWETGIESEGREDKTGRRKGKRKKWLGNATEG